MVLEEMRGRWRRAIRPVGEVARVLREIRLLARGPGHALRLQRAVIVLAVVRLLAPRRRIRLSVDVVLDGRETALVIGQLSEMFTLVEVFVLGDYADLPVETAKVVFDVGGNVGYAAIYFAHRFPDAQIHSFEPDPRAFPLLVVNTAHLPTVHAHQVAISDRDGTVSLELADATWSSSVSVADGPRGAAVVAVRAVTLRSAMREAGVDVVDLLKIDAEGSEVQILTGRDGDLEGVAAIIGELHTDLLKQPPEEFLRERLAAFEYRLRNAGDQALFTAWRR